jgi:hypothetical protein
MKKLHIRQTRLEPDSVDSQADTYCNRSTFYREVDSVTFQEANSVAWSNPNYCIQCMTAINKDRAKFGLGEV